MNEIDKIETRKLILETESLKIERNSRGYNHEYRLVGKVEDSLKRIDAIEKQIRVEIDKQTVDLL